MDRYYRFQEWEPLVLSWKEPSHIPSGQTYTITMPPPNVTGSLHLGHTLSSTLQDILIRFHRMQGYRVLWVPGTDHAGIATQMMVERDLESRGLTRKGLGREAFLQQVWDWKNKHGTVIVEQMKRLGFSAAWDRLCFTLDPPMNRGVNEAFIRLYEKGLIYRDYRLVSWDCQLKTALSDLEVVNRTEKGFLWTIFYPFDGQEREGIKVATTRPETLFGDVAVAVHPRDERYAAFIGRTLRLPLTDRAIPVIGDTAVNPAKGTGAVKVTPAHDFFDFEMALRHRLALISIMDESGCLNDRVPHAFQRLERSQARAQVLSHLGPLICRQESVEHSVPYSDRSGTVVEPRLTRQWFLDTKGMAEKAIAAVEEGKVVFVPAHWTPNFFEWMRYIRPWCISRQLWWGHPIPVWYGPENTTFVARTEREAYDQAVVIFGSSVLLTQEEDVLDTWFSSGLWPFSTLGWPENTDLLKEHYPTDVLVTGFDILFFWVARMLMLGLEMTEKVPFRTVVLHPLIRDEKGQKMSKTKKNVVNPLDLVQEYGSDALRFALISSPCGKQYMRFDRGHVEKASFFMTKIWNSVRFLFLRQLLAPESRSKIHQFPSDLRDPINQWFVWKVSGVITEVTEHLNHYRFYEAAQSLRAFMWNIFCDWFLEFSKGNLRRSKEETHHVLVWSLGVMVRLLHPFIPLMTEKIWHQIMGEEGTLLREPWPIFVYDKPEHAEDVEWMLQIISHIRRVKNQFSLRSNTLLQIFLYGVKDGQQRVLLAYQEDLCEWLHLEQITASAEAIPPRDQGAIFPMQGGGVMVVPLAHAVDVQDEKRRLAAEQQKAMKEVEQVKARIQNPDFVAHAPEEVVAELKDRWEEKQQVVQQITEALQVLESLDSPL